VLPLPGPEPPPAELAPSCAEAGVLGVLPGIIGSIQAMEAIKLLLGIGEPLAGRLLAYDALEESFRTFKVNRDPDCAACSIPKEQLVIAEYDELCMPHPIEVCGTRTVSTATFSLSDGLRLTLADLFVGGYLAYLSATADAQLQADGVTNPVATDFSAWALTPDSLEVTFPAGTVSFPLVSLTPYLRHPGPLQP
jgi:hypothetical protein